jgi:outer membrane autotransporter protein
VAGLTLGPIARLNYSRADLDGYQENIDSTDAGSGLALSVEGQKITSFSTVLGGQVSYAISLPWGVVLPQLRLEWEHEFENDSRTIRANFLEDPTPDDTSQIQLLTDAPDRDFFNIAAGVSAVLRRGLSAFVQYQTVIGLADVKSHHVALGLRIEL